jgi:hypothetical protein
MSLEVSKYDVLYGRLLKLGVAVDQAKALAKVLYDISIEQGAATDDLLKYVNSNGLRFDNEVYALLNNARTNSSQIGFIDQNNIPPAITTQAV